MTRPGVTWYTDETAKRVHAELAKAMKPILAELCPNHELSHLGRAEAGQRISALLPADAARLQCPGSG